jgi:pimeloyl-ACP methyl ester carboxylesterase
VKIQASGIHINVRDRGRGEPTLVLLHYWGGSSRTWAELIDQLEDRYRSIAIDQRGWGESDAPPQGYGISDLADDAQSVISAMEIKRYLVVGHSMGGKVAQLVASRRPVGLVGLVLVAPSPPSPTVLDNEQLQILQPLMLSLERSGRLSSTCKPHSSGFIERTHIRTLQHHGECHAHLAHVLGFIARAG